MNKKIEIEDTDLKGNNKSQKNNRFVKFWMKNNRRNLKVFVSAIIVALLVFAVIFGIYYWKMLNQITIDTGENYTTPTEEYSEENFETMNDVSDADSLNGMLYQWANNNGEKMHDRNIINVLLLGLDSENGSIASARSDCMILVSINKKNKKVHLTSFYRDSYTYVQYNGNEEYCKLNAAFYYGGPKVLIETLENNYKIEIDKYVSVDFKTFPELIDALGGVTVEIQPYEAEFINETTRYTVESGKAVTLPGKEALVFSRIRHCDTDGDVSRTRRQRQVIQAIIDSAKNASSAQINRALNKVLPFVTTNFTRKEILSLGAQALSQDWMNFPRIQLTMPKQGVDGWDAMIGDQSVWVVDYPVCANKLQKSIYGKSNIIIDEQNRTSAQSFVVSGYQDYGY